MQGTDEQKADDVLSRMLSTPPKPHESGKESKAGKKKPGTKAGL